MLKEDKNKQTKTCILALFLFILFLISLILLAGRLARIGEENRPSKVIVIDKASISKLDEIPPLDSEDANSNLTTDDLKENSVSNPETNVVDKNGIIWNESTHINIFSSTYKNGEQIITATSNNGEKIIAPGTNGSYVFEIKNTGNVAIDYTLETLSEIEPFNMQLPVEIRIKRYDGYWVTGNNGGWLKVNNSNLGNDKFTLGANKRSYYTLYWRWTYEGEDSLDTHLGNEALENDIMLRIKLNTFATENIDKNATGGISFSTGDMFNIGYYFAMAIISMFGIILVLLPKRKEKDKEEEN